MDEWQRWANAGVQEELCQRVEKLMEVDDLALAAKQLREAQAQWKQVAIAPREQSQALWNRFKAASDAVRAQLRRVLRTGGDRAGRQPGAQGGALPAGRGAVELVRLDQDRRGHQGAAGRVEDASAPAPRAQEKALWDRFHAACDGFFTRRREDLQQRKEEWAANLAKKEALCAQAEAIAETTDWQKGVEEIKRLQAEWKTIGPVRKTRADAVWQRFRAACDRFFERYQQRDQLAAVGESSADAEAVLQEFESLVPAEGDGRRRRRA